MALSFGRRRAPTPERGILRIQVRGLSGHFTEWETLGALTSIARQQGVEVEVVWLCDDPSAPPRR